MSYSPVLGHPKPQFFDDDGNPLSGGKVYFYEAGTSDALDTYTDSTGVTANANPIILNTRGEPTTAIYGPNGTAYKVNLTDSSDVNITNWPIDNVYPGNGSTDEWINPLTASRASTRTFTVADASTFHKGLRVKLTGGADRFGYVVGVSGTTVTVGNIVDSSNASATLHVSMTTVYKSVLTLANYVTALPNFIKDVQFVEWHGGGPNESGANNAAAITAAEAALPSTGGTVLFSQPGTYTVASSATALESDWITISSGSFPYNAHVGHEIDKSNVTYRGVGGTILKLASTNQANEISYIMGSSKDSSLSNISFYDLAIDLDKSGNSSAEQARGLFLMSIDNVYVDRSVRFFSSTSGSAAYALVAGNCDNIELNHHCNSINGAALVYCNNIKTDVMLDTFSEGIDLDKVCKNATIRGTFLNGGECIDSNATLGLTVDITAQDCGRVFTATPKDGIASTWSNYVAGSSLSHQPHSDFTFRGNIYNCAYAKSTPVMTIGHSWSDGTHANIDPIERGTITGTFYKVGQINVKECKSLTFHDFVMDDAVVSDSGTQGALDLRSEGDWSTYPDAETWSDLDVTLNNVQIKNANHNGIYINYPGKVIMRHVVTDTTSTEAASTDSGVRIEQIDDRNAIIDIDGLRCANGYDGLLMNAATGGSAVVTLNNLDLTDTNSNVDLRLLGDIAEYIVARRESCYFGTVAAGTPDERPLIQPRKAAKVLDCKLFAAADITQSDTDYSAYTLRKRNSDGSTAATIVSSTTEATGGIDVNAFSPVSLGQSTIVGDADSIMTQGQILTLVKTDTNNGQGCDELKAIVDWVEY